MALNDAEAEIITARRDGRGGGPLYRETFGSGILEGVLELGSALDDVDLGYVQAKPKTCSCSTPSAVVRS